MYGSVISWTTRGLKSAFMQARIAVSWRAEPAGAGWSRIRRRQFAEIDRVPLGKGMVDRKYGAERLPSDQPGRQ